MRWRETEFERYFVSDTGCVRGPSGKLLSIQKNNKGYSTVCINDRQRLVHRLVAKAFILNPENKLQVNHKDGNKKNNNWLNLEWCTQSYNVRHALLVLRKKIGNFTKGNYEKKGIKKYNDSRKIKIFCLETKEQFDSIREAGKKTKIDATSISRCVSKKQKTAGGLHWGILFFIPCMFLFGCSQFVPVQNSRSCVDMTTYVNNGKTAAQVISRERLCEKARTGL